MRRRAVYDARRLRRSLSLPEVMLWQRLKGSPQGLRFRKQHPVDPYVVDFYCAAARLIIEIDGIVHDMGDKPKRDEARERFLESKGYSVIRIAAKDIMIDANAVADSILVLVMNPLHQVSLGPPPRPGEDL